MMRRMLVLGVVLSLCLPFAIAADDPGVNRTIDVEGTPIESITVPNVSTDGVDFPIPGNDDASRAISLYCDLVSKTILDGMESQLGSAGIDLGEAQTPLSGDLPQEEGLEQEVNNEVIPEDKKKADEPKSNSSEAIVESKSTDGKEGTSKVSVSEKEQDIVKNDSISKTEIDKGK